MPGKAALFTGPAPCHPSLFQKTSLVVLPTAAVATQGLSDAAQDLGTHPWDTALQHWCTTRLFTSSDILPGR